MVDRIVDIGTQILNQTDLRGVLHTLLLILGTLLQSQTGIICQISQTGPLLEICELALRRTQLMVNDTDAFLDKLGGFLGYLIFLVVRVLIIKRYQTINKIHSPFLYRIIHTDLCYGCGLGRGCHAQIFHILLGSLYRSVYSRT